MPIIDELKSKARFYTALAEILENLDTQLISVSRYDCDTGFYVEPINPEECAKYEAYKKILDILDDELPKDLHL